jgi:uncharacterized protein with beta-barrel porin domain
VREFVAKVGAGLFMLALAWPAGEASAQCVPPAVGATPSNTTVNCNGPVLNQNAPDGYGNGNQANDTINVQTGSVTGTSSGFNLGAGNTINVANGTSVNGGINGIATALGTTIVNNNGTIAGSGTGFVVINGIVTPGSLTATNTGTISATTTGVGIAAIAINASTSVNLTNTGGHVTASSNGGEAVGVQGNAVTVNSTGTISATGGTSGGSLGVFGLNSVAVTNNGTISVDDTGGTDLAAGVASLGTLNLTNGGTIQATGFQAVGVLADGTTTTAVTNTGTISGAFEGINSISATTTIINSGLITGTTDAGIRASTASIENDAGGTISGLTGIFFRANKGPSSIFDAGQIIGTGGTAIQFSTGSVGNTLTLAPTFSITGKVLGAGSDIFQLGGSGTGSFDLSTIGATAQFEGFTTFNVLSGTWVVSNTFGQTQAWNVDGGVLAGTGTLSSVNVNNGGVLAPGLLGVPGTTMTISGSLVFQSAAIYMVQLNSTSTTRANVTGNASLNGTVFAAVTANGPLQHQYTILHSGGLNGTTFSSLVTTGLPNGLTASLSYNADDVFLVFNTALAQQPGLNVNEQNVANAIANFFNNGGMLPASFVGILGLTGANLGNALTQLDGEVATGAQTTAFELMNEFLGLLTDPFDEGRAGNAGLISHFAPEQTADLPPEIALAYASVLKAPPKAAAAFDRRWSVWGAGFGGSETIAGNAAIGSNRINAAAFGGAAGIDYRVMPNTVVGFALSGAGTNWSLAQGLGSGRSDAFQAGVYAKSYLGAGYVTAALAFAEHWMATSRVALGDQLNASFNAQNFAGRIEAGYRYGVPMPGMAAAVIPYAAVQAQDFHTPAYREVDLSAGGFGLSFAERTASATRSELGARFEDLTTLSGRPLLLRAKVAWAHDWVSSATDAALFQALPGAGFLVTGAAQPKDSALVSSGAQVWFTPHWTFLAKFDGEFAQTAQTYAGTGTLRYSW